MELEERIAALAAQQAKLRARLDTLSLAFYSLLAGELTTARCAKLKESLIANALSTSAPDVAIDGFEEEFSRLQQALIAGRIP
mgnify:CR=1 FL=1